MTALRALDPARHAGSAVLQAQSDARLVELARDGNERAFEAIVHRYRRSLLRHCARILPAGRAEDAVQQAFMKAHAALAAGGEAEIELRPWLYRIARNTALNVLRENGWHHEQLDERIDGVERPPEAVERRDRLRAVLAAVQRLPERQRDALVLRELEGRSYDEIAAKLTVSDGAVRQLLNRARTTLRAGITALTPSSLLMRIAARDSTLVERLSTAGAGAGGLAGLAKLSVGALLGGAIVAGGGAAALHGSSSHRHVHASLPAATATRDAMPAAAATAGKRPASGQPSTKRSVSGGPGMTRAGEGRRPAATPTAVAHRDSHGDGGGSSRSGGDGGHATGTSGDHGSSGGGTSDGHGSDGGGSGPSGDGTSGSSTPSGTPTQGSGTDSRDGGGGTTTSGGGGGGDGSSDGGPGPMQVVTSPTSAQH